MGLLGNLPLLCGVVSEVTATVWAVRTRLDRWRMSRQLLLVASRHLNPPLHPRNFVVTPWTSTPHKPDLSPFFGSWRPSPGTKPHRSGITSLGSTSPHVSSTPNRYSLPSPIATTGVTDTLWFRRRRSSSRHALTLPAVRRPGGHDGHVLTLRAQGRGGPGSVSNGSPRSNGFGAHCVFSQTLR